MSKIRVALRVRPLSDRESSGGFPVVLAVEQNSAFITDIRVPERPKADSRARYREFNFDHAFWLEEDASEGAAQSEIYREMGPPLEKSILQGYNSCVLAYGQSGTGKTHTMLGTKDEPGMIPRLCHSIWDKLKVKEDIEGHSSTLSSGISKLPTGFRMEVSFMEIYREKVRDLLSPQSELKLREHPQYGPHVQNLSRVEVTGEMGLLDLLWEGECRRAIGTTGSNRRSSRSHAIWTIYLTRANKNPTHQNHTHTRAPPTSSKASSSSNASLITNRVHLVDLAGSEKAGFATAKNLLAEGADINRSLVALGNVISSLAEKASYIPYRDSALTWLLKDSLGGNATTAIIITASPASCCHAQTLNSFRFAQRARLVENRPRINVTSISNFPPGSSSPALYSIMSAFEIKKDISKLSRIIRSAQTNGGLLRGLAPRATWHRLVTALEGYNAIESEQLKLQREALEESTTSNVSSVKSNTPAKEGPPPSSTETPVSSSPSSKNSTPTRIIGTEVFIPCSNSIKCLTWQQEEPHPVPKPPSSDEDEEYSSVKMTPPPTPPSSSGKVKVHHLKYLLPVQYPVTHHLDHAARISEKIHGSFSGEGPKKENIQPVEVIPGYMSEGDSPLIRDRIPTLVNPKDISPVMKTCSEKILTQPGTLVPVRCKSVFNFASPITPDTFDEFTTPSPPLTPTLHQIDSDQLTLEEEQGSEVRIQNPSKFRLANSKTIVHSFTPPIPPVSSTQFATAKQPESQIFEKLDKLKVPTEEMQGSEVKVPQRPSKLRMVHSKTPKKHNLTLKIPPIPPVFSTPVKKPTKIFENTDPNFIAEGEVKGSAFKQIPSKYRTVYSSTPKQEDFKMPLVSPQESCCFPSESILSSSSSTCSNSVKSLNIPLKRRTLVKVIPEDSEALHFLDESISDILNDLNDFSSGGEYNYNPQMVTTVLVDVDGEDKISRVEEEPPPLFESVDPCLQNNIEKKERVDGATGSKFRDHFVRELHEMEKIGKQLKKLREMSQRFDVVKPFLDEISQLDEIDHGMPDEKVDAEIESCCGWNVQIEFDKVNTEMHSLSKLLHTGIAPLTSVSSSRPQRRDSLNSTTTIASSTTSKASNSVSRSTLGSTGGSPPSSPPLHHFLSQRDYERRASQLKMGHHATTNFYPRESSTSTGFAVPVQNSRSEPTVGFLAHQYQGHEVRGYPHEGMSAPYIHPHTAPLQAYGDIHQNNPYFQTAARALISQPQHNRYLHPSSHAPPPIYGNSQPFIASSSSNAYLDAYGHFNSSHPNATPPPLYYEGPHHPPNYRHASSSSVTSMQSSASSYNNINPYSDPGSYHHPSLQSIENPFDQISNCSTFNLLSRDASSVNMGGYQGQGHSSEGDGHHIYYPGQSSIQGNPFQGSDDFCSCDDSLPSRPNVNNFNSHTHNHLHGTLGQSQPPYHVGNASPSRSYQNIPHVNHEQRVPTLTPSRSASHSPSHSYSSAATSSTISSNDNPSPSHPSSSNNRFQNSRSGFAKIVSTSRRF